MTNEGPSIPDESANAPQPATWAAPSAPPPQTSTSAYSPSQTSADTGFASPYAPISSGYSQPPVFSPQPSYGHDSQPHYASGAPAPGYGIPAYGAGMIPGVFSAQPGIIPLRPLLLTDLFDGTFKALRATPGALFGFAFVLMSIVAVIGTAVNAAVVLTPELAGQQAMEAGLNGNEALAAYLISLFGGQFIFYLAQFFATIFLAGAAAVPVSEAVIGRKLPLQAVWPRMKPSFWRLMGLAFLVATATFIFIIIYTLLLVSVGVFFADRWGDIAVLFAFLLTAPLTLIPVVFLSVRLIYVAPVIVLENQPVFFSMRRSWALTAKNFWSTFGRLLVVNMAVNAMSSFVLGSGLVVGVVTALFLTPEASLLVWFFISILLSGLFLPISGAFTTLMYLDRRIRTEGLADSLLKASQQ